MFSLSILQKKPYSNNSLDKILEAEPPECEAIRLIKKLFSLIQENNKAKSQKIITSLSLILAKIKRLLINLFYEDFSF